MNLKQSDPMGQAITDYFHQRKTNKLVVKSDVAEDDQIEIPYLFRRFEEMPILEQKALLQCRGSVLDVGAGTGCHSLWLQNNGVQVTALEISTMACEILKLRGIKQIINDDFFTITTHETFDTLLFLMNGIGISKTLNSRSLIWH